MPPSKRSWAKRDQQVTWIDQLQAAHVQAVRRNSPDLQQQLFQSLERPIDTILCTILDVDPNACLNSTIAARYPREIHAAVMLLLASPAPHRAISVIDDRLPNNWLGQLRRLTRRSGHRLVTLHNDYPQADPTILLYTLLSRHCALAVCLPSRACWCLMPPPRWQLDGRCWPTSRCSLRRWPCAITFAGSRNMSSPPSR